MSDTLDEKLRPIVKAIIDARQYIDGDTRYMTNEELDDAIAQIKQAIKDAGYVQYEKSMLHNFKTGQEWYDRFFEETKSMRLAYIPLTGENVDKAAKRAAGLDTEGEGK